MKPILHVLLAALLIAFGSSASAQNNFPKCLAKIQERLDALGDAGKQQFNIAVVRQEIKTFDFGNLPDVVADANKIKAFKRVYESLSEFIDLTTDQLSAKGMKGYTKYTGGVIRADGTDFVEDLKKVFGGSAFDKPGFNAVMEVLNDTGTWTAQGVWKSNGGVIYKTGSNEGHRISHLLSHTQPGYKPPPATHSVFSGPRQALFNLIDEAWAKPRTQGLDRFGNPDTGAWVVDMGRVIGTDNQTKIRYIIKSGTTHEIITAYPVTGLMP